MLYKIECVEYVGELCPIRVRWYSPVNVEISQKDDTTRYTNEYSSKTEGIALPGNQQCMESLFFFDGGGL